MNVLLDTCVWGGAKAELHTAGHDVFWTGDLAQDPGDEEILAQAHREHRVLITLEKDFGELAIWRSLPHCGIVRLVNIPARQQAVPGGCGGLRAWRVDGIERAGVHPAGTADRSWQGQAGRASVDAQKARLTRNQRCTASYYGPTNLLLALQERKGSPLHALT
jgi:predicted nuclease of predicted toxin-antitoxin system